jgi:hypothetical protein
MAIALADEELASLKRRAESLQRLLRQESAARAEAEAAGRAAAARVATLAQQVRTRRGAGAVVGQTRPSQGHRVVWGVA